MIRRLARAAGAAVALAAVVVGLPVLLVVFGRSPLDGSGSLWGQLSRFPTQTISDQVAFGLLTIATWVSWAVFSLHVVVELAAAFGTAVRLRVPAAGLFQMSARRLVTALTMSASLSVSLGQRASTVPMLATSASELPVSDPAPDLGSGQSFELVVEPVVAVAPAADDLPAAVIDAEVAAPVVTVVPGDSPWALAERHLGNGVRWRELWDLNRGVPQPDGRSWVTEDLIRPGWRFTLPADAMDVPARPAAPAPVPAPADTPEVREPTLPPPDGEDAGLPASGGSDREVPAAPEATGPSATPAPVEPEPRPADGPDDAPTVTSVPAPADDSVLQEGPDGSDADDDATGLPVVPLLGAAGTLLAVGVVRELRRRRDRRATLLPVDVVPALAPHAAVGTELLARAEFAAGDRLDAALLDLAQRLRPNRGGACPQPRVVQVVGDRIDVLLDRPEPAASGPWRVDAGGLVWVLDPDQRLSFTDDIAPLPALVTVGTGDAEIMVDLEAHGVVALVGSEDACVALARSMVAELSARSEGTVGVEVVGDLHSDDLFRFDGVRCHAGWDDVDVQTIETSARLLEAGGWPHTWAARASGRIYDGWAPTVWITRPGDHERYQEAIQAVDAHPGAGSAVVVVGGDPDRGLRINVDSHGRFDIPQLNLRGVTQGLDADVTGQLADLLDDAETMPDPDDPAVITIDDTIGAGEGHVADTPLDLAAVVSNGGAYQDPPFDVLVRVCGPIRVDGGMRRLSQRETAIAAYVALNGEVDIEKIRDAIWAGAGVALKTTRNMISSVRKSVGEAVVFTPEHRLAAGRGLITDLELIRRRMAHARDEPDPARKAEMLEGALGWVSGRICSYPESSERCWTWIDLDNWIAHIGSTVATLASDLACLCLDLGDGEGARSAARRGTEAVGRRDQLTILETLAYELLGDEASARATIRAHERHLNDLGVEEFNEDLLVLLDRYATPAHHKPTT